MISPLTGPIPEWVDGAVCAQVDPAIFFPELGGKNRTAERLCSSCPVSTDCLEYALVNDEQFGVWAGTSERERRKIRRDRQRAVA